MDEPQLSDERKRELGETSVDALVEELRTRRAEAPEPIRSKLDNLLAGLDMIDMVTGGGDGELSEDDQRLLDALGL